MDHLDCRFCLMLLSFSAPLSEVEKNKQGSVCIKENCSGYVREIKKERSRYIIKHNTCDSEEENGESYMPTNYLTPGSNVLFPDR